MDDAQVAGSLGPRAAAALVFFSSAAVLVVELTALRLLAPYVGLTLQTNTLVIGMALAAIAAGSWAGGKAADAVDPRRLLAPLLAVSGVAVAFTPAIIRSVAEFTHGLVFLAAALTILVPGALLSAITPIATKLRLTTLDQTGTVVGGLSGIGTVGAIVGTVITGFVLVSRVPVSAILVGLGMALVLGALLVAWRARSWRQTVPAALAVVAGGLAAVLAPGGCDAETTYHCAVVEVSALGTGSGRTLVLDGLRHSYVDLEDPTHLEFVYIRAIAATTDAAFPGDEPLEAYHLGGGGLTFPRYLAVTRPGSRSLVSEIDGGVVRIDRERLGLRTDADLAVRVEDGRSGLARLATDSRDLVVGDAFGGVSVPWHLTTEEAMAEVHRVLRPDGVYVANLIDYGDLDFARAEAATLEEVFDHVLVAGQPHDVLAGDVPPDGGNLLVVASDRALDVEALRSALQAGNTGWTAVDGAARDAWIGDAQVLTDDYAPVDQLLDPYASALRG